MRVTHAEDHVTHAVIGANQTHSFQINDSTEFFRILSSSLYSDKILAVVREILCNAWDAHIEHGCTDLPIEVSLDTDKLVIRDRGPGLCPDDIIRLYTTYGGTSKIANDNVTGGFGLGSKAPFAYGDHFETTSYHAGLKTIYNMSLSSALVDGKPSVMKILDLPTTETGMQVSIQLKDKSDYHKFRKVLERVVANGEMNVELNGTKLQTLTFSDSPHGFTIVKNEEIGGLSTRIYIRYGHVVYPLEMSDDFSEQIEKVKTFLRKLHGDQTRQNYGYRSHSEEPSYALVLQAKPGTVSITPSRESLSMTDHTIKSVEEMIRQFLSITREGLDPHCFAYLKEAIIETVKTKSTAQLFHPRRVLPNKGYFNNMRVALPKQITTLQQAAACYISHSNYPQSLNFFSKDLAMRLSAMIDAGIGDKGLLNSYRAEIRRLESPKSRSAWLYRKVLWPLVRDIKEETLMRHENLFVLDNAKDRFGQKRLLAQPYRNFAIEQIRFGLPYLRKLVTISHNRMDVLDHNYADLGQPGSMQKELGSITGSLLYIVPRNPQKIAAARTFFVKRGYVINDWTPNQKAEPKDKTAFVGPVQPPKPKRVGVPTLSNLLVPGSKEQLNMSLLYDEDNKLTETPEIVIFVSPNRQNLPDLGIPPRGLPAFIELFGDAIAAVPSAASVDKLVEKGVSNDSLPDWVLPKILEEFKTNKLIRQHYKNYRAHDVDPNHEQTLFLSIIRRDLRLRKMFNLPNPVEGRELALIKLYESWPGFDHRYKPKLKEIADLIKTWDATSSLKKLLEKLKSNNPLLKCIDASTMAGLMRAGKPEAVSVVRKLLLYAMKG